jgi:hypothetical protein
MKRVIFGLGIVSLGMFGIVERSDAQAVLPDGTLNTNVTRALNDFT